MTTTTPTTTPTTAPAAAAERARSWTSLVLLHARVEFLQTVRVPIAVIGNLLFPGMALLFFVVPQRVVAGDPVAATAAVAQLAAFAVMSVSLFSFGVGVAEDRALPFDPYVRTLPAGAGPRLGGRVINALVWTYLALVPLVLIGAFLTEATMTLGQIAASIALVPAVLLPFLFLGLAIGYRMSAKAAIAVVQATLFPLAFAGGLFLPPQAFPAWLETASRVLPSRAVRDVVVEVASGVPAYTGAVAVLLAWTVLFGALAVLGHRRDEGRRFR